MNIQEEKKYKYSRITYLDLVKAQKAPFYIDLQQYSPLREENIITLEVIEDQNIASYIKIGIVVHLIFKEIVMESLQIYEKKWQQQQLTMLLRYKVLLLHYGVAPLVIDFALSIVKIAIENILCSKCGRWILSQHLGSKAELALINLSPQKREHIIIDRLFVEDNILWIIDYKLTHGVKKPVLADFPEYHTQLQYYAQIMRHSTIKQIKLGLYFPLTDTWLSWDFNG